MDEPTEPSVRPSATPCPNCGYDLRGHPSIARCSECGEHVAVDAALARTIRWVDLRLLDLWSIAIVQSAGCVAGVLSLLAIRGGHYSALILGMAAELALCVATLWFAALTPGIFLRLRSPIIRALKTQQARRLRCWWVFDAALIAVPPSILILY